MKRVIRLVHTICLIVGLNGASVADVIVDWNEIAVAANQTARQPNSVHARAIAMVHLAMFEALNSIEPRYRPYKARLSVEPGASGTVAAAAAAHHVLAKTYPDQAKELDKVFFTFLGTIAEGAAKANGIRLGEQAGAAMVAERVGDYSAASNQYRPFTTAGKYVPTEMPIESGTGSVRPFGLQSADQFRPAAPYLLTSSSWAKDYDEVKRLGAKIGSARTAEQSEIARFWEQTGASTYNPIVRQISTAKNVETLENARLFALVSMATVDGYIAVFDSKYAYGFWRPITAIRNGDIDGNDATERDAAWESFIATPMHPEYPCAHCTIQASAAAVLDASFGDTIPAVTVVSATAPGVSRRFNKLSEYVTEVINARVYGGIHYRISGEVGAEMGRKIGKYIVQNYLIPAP